MIRTSFLRVFPWAKGQTIATHPTTSLHLLPSRPPPPSGKHWVYRKCCPLRWASDARPRTATLIPARPSPELTNCGSIVAAMVNASDLPRSANLDIAHLCGSRGEGEPAYTRHFTNPTPSSALSTPPLPTWRRRNGNSTSSSPTCPCRPTPPATRSLRSGPVSVVTGVLL